MDDCLGEEGHYDLAKDTVSLVTPSEMEHQHSGFVENLQLIQPHFRKESACCPRSALMYLVLASCMAGLGGVLFGYDIGIVSGAILQLRTEFRLDCVQQEMVVSSMLMGAMLASLTGGFIVDYVGRRMAIIVNSIIFFVGALILAFSPSFAVVVVGRIIVGFGVSLSAIAECIYISEIAPPKKRGLLVSINELGICVGLLLAYLVNVLFIDLNNGWRYMFGLSGVPAIIQGIGMFFLPKSPRWLVVNGKDQQACATINQLRWLGDPNEEVMRIKSGLRVEYKYRLSDLVSNMDNMRSRMFIGCGIVFFQQFTGQPTVVYYASTIFQALGFQSGSKATLASLGIGLAKLGATVFSLSAVDKGGRRRFLLIGASVMTLSILTLGVISRLKPMAMGAPSRRCDFNSSTIEATRIPPTSLHTSTVQFNSSLSNLSSTTVSSTVMTTASDAADLSTELRYVSVVALVLFVGAFSFGYGPVCWLLLSEIYPVAIKGRAFSIATLVNWGSNLVVSLTFLDMLSTVGTAWTFIVYAFVGILSVIFIYKFVPETKNKTLEQISAELSSRKPLTICTKLPCCKKTRVKRRRFSLSAGSASDMLLSAASSETHA